MYYMNLSNNAPSSLMLANEFVIFLSIRTEKIEMTDPLLEQFFSTAWLWSVGYHFLMKGSAGSYLFKF